MTQLAPATLLDAATAAGLTVLASARWPETITDTEVKPLAGFVVSTFNPLLAEVAERCLSRRPAPTDGTVTAVIVVTEMGDVTSAMHVSAAVDAGERVRPLLFFQSVPNAVAGYVAARRHLSGPMVCVSDADAGLALAALLIDDADADEALVVSVDVALTEHDSDRAAAVLVTARGSEGAEQ
jgi:hypothetical protein